MNRILWNRRPDGDDPGCIDEVVIDHPEMVHVEQMDDRTWWIGIYTGERERWAGHFVAEGSPLRFVESENDGVQWEEDSLRERPHA